jgi:phosphatidylserine decarboxylase
MILYIFIGILLFLLYFYRGDEFNSLVSNNIVLSPAYGTIKRIINDGKNITIIIFLSPFDIHYQYYPINGVITNIIHDTTGKFELAYKLDKSRYNEKVITVIQSNNGYVIIKQIAGFYVRRITMNGHIGESINAGQTMGMIKLGSRVDLIVPSQGFNLMVTEGQSVNGFNTIVGFY